jgi:hypothetical protein
VALILQDSMSYFPADVVVAQTAIRWGIEALARLTTEPMRNHLWLLHLPVVPVGLGSGLAACSTRRTGVGG